MSFDATKTNLTVGVVGTGTMGRGIAQIHAQAGIRTMMFDTNAKAVEAARASIADALGKQVERGRMKQEALDATMANLVGATELSAFAGCDVVIEAIIERIEAKRELFAALEGIVREDAILASNTSSLSVTAMAQGCKRPGRVAGYHYFNPVPLMKLVEVVDGAMTESWVGDALGVLARRAGHTPVRAADMPGFIVNHAGRAYVPESVRVLSEGIAEFHQIDRIMKDAAGFRMGPFELSDLVGLDVSHFVMESIYHQFYEEPRYRITPLLTQRVSAGLFGRKTKRGFYDYASGQAAAIPDRTVPQATKRPIWVSNAEPQLADKVRNAFVATGVDFEGGHTPSPDALIVVTPVGEDCTSAALAQGLDPRRTVAVDGLFPMDKRRTLMTSPATAPEFRDTAHAMLAAGGVPVSVVRDSPGFVAPRIVAQIVSIACEIAQQRIASPADIDVAVRLGLNYPNGPLAMGDAIGAKRILAILEGLYAFYGDPRYRPSAWLKRRAMLGLSLLTED